MLVLVRRFFDRRTAGKMQSPCRNFSCEFSEISTPTQKKSAFFSDGAVKFTEIFDFFGKAAPHISTGVGSVVSLAIGGSVYVVSELMSCVEVRGWWNAGGILFASIVAWLEPIPGMVSLMSRGIVYVAYVPRIFTAYLVSISTFYRNHAKFTAMQSRKYRIE